MEKGLKPNEFAATSEQVLPDATAELSAETRHGPRRHSHHAHESLTIVPGHAGPGFDADPGHTSRSVTTEPILTGERLMLDRLEQGILAEVRLTRQLKPDAMAIVLRPDAQTEILVQMTLREGSVHVHARCDRGDASWIEQQWGALQERLEDRGVRLGPLEVRSPEFANGGESGSSQRRAPHSDRQLFSGRDASTATAPPADRPATLPRPLMASRPTRLLESWA